MKNRERMSMVLDAEAFKRKLGAIATYSVRTHKEAAVVAYATKAAFRLSAMIRPKAEDYHDTWLEEEVHEYNSISLYDYVVSKKDTDMWRREVLMTVHSHPVEKDERLENAFYPSLADLESSEEYMMYNPDLVEGVLAAPDSSRAKLFLYRWTDRSRPNLYQQFHGQSPSAPALLQSMHDSGISTAVLDFTITGRSAVYTSDQAAGVVQALFPE